MASKAPADHPELFDRFGPLLRYLRVRAHMAQRDLAIAVGYSEAHISRLEQGQRRPDLDTVRAHFVSALRLDAEPAWAARLIALAAVEAAGDAGPAAPVVPAAPVDALQGLMATKIYCPRPRSKAVTRTRLLRRLDGALDVPLTLVAAPAGFGKSTLVASWISALGAPGAPRAAWLSLDAGDNELTVFLRYLIAALRTVAPGLGGDTLALLAVPEAPPLRALLTPLVNDLAALQQPVVLALDDYHLIGNQAIHEALDFLLERPPPPLRLVIITRSDPPLALTRLRGRGQLLELGAADLRFNRAEATTFLQQTMDLGVSDADAALLESRTDGWAAGLQLAALAMRDQADRASFVASFAGINQYVIDYLAEEVLDRLPGHLRSFLLQTSVLDRLCGELCDAVLGLTNAPTDGPSATSPPAPTILRNSYSQHLLDELERLNLFLNPLDGERLWYRYHPLFADVLRERLRAGTRREQVLELYRRASLWLWSRQLTGEAISCALNAPAYDLAAEQIEQVSRAMLGRGEHVALITWLKALPDGQLDRRPALALAYAWALFHTNEWRHVETFIARAEAALRADTTAGAPPSPLVVEILALRGCIACYSGSVQRGTSLSTQALRELPADDLRMRSAVLTALGTIHHVDGNAWAAQHNLLQAIEVGVRSRYLFPTIHGHYYCMAGWLILGEYERIATQYERARRFAAEMGSPQSPALGMVLVMRGRMAYEQNRLEEARGYLGEALELCRQLGYPEALADAHMALARLALVVGDVAAAEEHLEQGRAIVRQAEVHPIFVAEFIYADLSLLLARGVLAEAAAAAQAYGLDARLPASFRRYFEIVAQARLAIAQGRPATATELLRELLTIDHFDELRGVQIDIFVPLALALHAAGETEQALEVLERALAAAAPSQIVRIFLDAGPPMRALLGAARPRTASPAFCDELLAAFPAE